MFTQQPLSNIDKKNLYNALASSVEFETIGRGREGAILVDDRDGRVPLYRSTSEFKRPVQRFRPIHHELVASIGLPLNNALIERYSSDYRRMGWHSDQSLDLNDESVIAVVSAYNRDPQPHEVRKLHVVKKGDSKDKWEEVPLDHGTVVLFSTATNQTYVHRIMLDTPKDTSILWIGVTFRLAKTFLQFRSSVPYLIPEDVQLRVATDKEKGHFFQAKGQQNSNEGYQAPVLEYTLSIGDTIPPVD